MASPSERHWLTRELRSEEVAVLDAPLEDHDARDAALRVIRWGPILDVSKARQMASFGAVLAVTDCEGTRWPYTRGAWAEDNLVRWSAHVDRILYDAIMNRVRAHDLESTLATLRAEVTMIRPEVDLEWLAAFEAVVRLGDSRAVLAFLESA